MPRVCVNRLLGSCRAFPARDDPRQCAPPKMAPRAARREVCSAWQMTRMGAAVARTRTCRAEEAARIQFAATLTVRGSLNMLHKDCPSQPVLVASRIRPTTTSKIANCAHLRHNRRCDERLLHGGGHSVSVGCAVRGAGGAARMRQGGLKWVRVPTCLLVERSPRASAESSAVGSLGGTSWRIE